MRIRLNAEILLCLPGVKELTEEERGSVILGAEGRLNEVGVFTMPNLGRVGIRVHIADEKDNTEPSCVICKLLSSERVPKEYTKDGVTLLGSETGRFMGIVVEEQHWPFIDSAPCPKCGKNVFINNEAKMCNVCGNIFCSVCVDNHTHCMVCDGTGKVFRSRSNLVFDIGTITCTECKGTGLEQ